MSRQTFVRIGKLVSLALIISGHGLISTEPAAAATRRPKVKLQQPKQEISEAYYDKAWRTWQIGSKKEKEEVIKSLRSIVRKSPEEFMAHYYLGIMVAEEGSPAQAL